MSSSAPEQAYLFRLECHGNMGPCRRGHWYGAEPSHRCSRCLGGRVWVFAGTGKLPQQQLPISPCAVVCLQPIMSTSAKQ